LERSSTRPTRAPSVFALARRFEPAILSSSARVQFSAKGPQAAPKQNTNSTRRISEAIPSASGLPLCRYCGPFLLAASSLKDPFMHIITIVILLIVYANVISRWGDKEDRERNRLLDEIRRNMLSPADRAKEDAARAKQAKLALQRVNCGMYCALAVTVILVGIILLGAPH